MLYGNLMNRIMENDEGTNDIKVGTRLTEYLYSDRNVWEVIEVKSKKNVVVRELSAKHNVAFSNNDVELFSDENNRVMELVFRYNNWYEKYIDYSGNVKYDKIKVVFGREDYYYDFSF